MVSFVLYVTRPRHNRLNLTNFGYVLVALILILFAAFRDASVGSDTSGYAARYAFLEGFSAYSHLFSYEFAFTSLYILAHFISDNYWALLLLVATIVVSLYLRTITRLSLIPPLSIYLFITLGYYLFFFNGARQGIAAALFFYSYEAILKRNLRMYLVIGFVAGMFHTTAFLVLPLYFIFSLADVRKYTVLIAVGSAIGIIFIQDLLLAASTVSDRYEIYSQSATGGELITLFYVLNAVVLWYLRRIILTKYLSRYDFYLNIFLFGVSVFLIVYYSGAYIEIVRIAFYFQPALILLWPFVFASLHISDRVLWYYIFYLIHALYFYMFISTIGDLMPFEFNRTI